MALSVAGTLAANIASTQLDWVDNTGTGVTGYGNGSNRPTSSNIATEYIFTFPDLSTVTITADGTTIPTTDFTPKNALLRSFTIAQLGLGGTLLPDGVIIMRENVWFTTPSAGVVGVTNGSPTVTNAGGQNFTTDFFDSMQIRINGVNYVIATVTATVITLTTNYASTTSLLAVAYVGYSTTVGALIVKGFLDCWSPAWAVLDTKDNCESPKERSLFNLYCIYLSVQAKMTELDFAGANTLLIDLIALCECEDTVGGCC